MWAQWRWSETYLDFRDHPHAVEYEWIDIKIVGTSSIMSIKVVIDVYGIVVGDPLECRFFLWGRIRWYVVPFCDFEIVVLKKLKVVNSQLHSESWVSMRIFQLYAEHKSLKPFAKLFFVLFHLRCTSIDFFLQSGAHIAFIRSILGSILLL